MESYEQVTKGKEINEDMRISNCRKERRKRPDLEVQYSIEWNWYFDLCGASKTKYWFLFNSLLLQEHEQVKRHSSKTTTTHIDRDGHDRSEAKQNKDHHIPVIILKYLIIIKKRMNRGRGLALMQGQHYEERHVKEFLHSVWLAKVKERLVRKWYKKETRKVSSKLTSLIF